jgi:hypothetical protein
MLIAIEIKTSPLNRQFAVFILFMILVLGNDINISFMQ